MKRLHRPSCGWAWLVVGLLVALVACSAPPSAPTAKPAAEGPAPAAAAARAPTSPTVPTAVQPLTPPVPVKVGTLGIGSEAAIYIAYERGYFRDEGLEVELIHFARGSEQMAPLATGELHFGSGSPDPSLFNAAARGIGVKIVGINAVVNQDYNATHLVIRKDLIDRGRYRDLHDLRGMTLAVSGAGSVAQIYLEHILARGGLTRDDVTETVVPFPDMLAGLANRGVDAAWITEPYLNVAESEGLAQRVIGMADVYRGLIVQALLLSPVFARDQPEAARRFVTAHLRGARDYYHGMIRGEGKDAIIQILTKHTNIKDPAQYARIGTHGVAVNGEIDEQILSDMQDYFVRYGTQQQKVDVMQVVDLSYLNYALARLGPSQ